MLEALKAELSKPNTERYEQLKNDLINDVIDNEEKINHHGKRADLITMSLLNEKKIIKTAEQIRNNLGLSLLFWKRMAIGEL